MDKFQVPQFIDTEDKIFGPFTLKQFLYIAAAGGILFFLFFYVTIQIWFVFFLIFGGVAAAFVFVRYNGHSFAKILYLGFKYYWNPRLYLWKRSEIPQEPIQEPTPEVLPSPQHPISRKPQVRGQIRDVERRSTPIANLPTLQFGKVKDLWQQLLTSKGKIVREKTATPNGYATIKAPGGGHIPAHRVDYSE